MGSANRSTAKPLQSSGIAAPSPSIGAVDSLAAHRAAAARGIRGGGISVTERKCDGSAATGTRSFRAEPSANENRHRQRNIADELPADARNFLDSADIEIRIWICAKPRHATAAQ